MSVTGRSEGAPWCAATSERAADDGRRTLHLEGMRSEERPWRREGPRLHGHLQQARWTSLDCRTRLLPCMPSSSRDSLPSHPRILLHGRTYPSPVFIYPHLHCSPRHTSTSMALSHGLLFCIPANPHTPVMHHLLYAHLSLSVLEGICIHRRCYCFGHNLQDTNLSVRLLAVLVIFLAWARCLSKYYICSLTETQVSAKEPVLLL